MIFVSRKLEVVVVGVTLTLPLDDKRTCLKTKRIKHLIVAWLVLVSVL